MRQLRKGSLFAAVAIPVLFALFGGALVGGNGVGWFARLDKPRYLIPLWMFT
jgi:tryptophan-rich sensory protein